MGGITMAASYIFHPGPGAFCYSVIYLFEGICSWDKNNQLSQDGVLIVPYCLEQIYDS